MRMTRIALAFVLAAAMWAVPARAQGPAPAAAPPAATAPPAASAALTAADLKAVAAPKPEDRAKGDPDGALTGTVADIAISDAKVGLTMADVLNQIGANK